MEEICTTYIGVKFVGFRGRDGGISPITQTVWRDIIQAHVICNGMWDCFLFKDPCLTHPVDLFMNLGRYLLIKAKEHMAKITRLADSYILQNLTMSGQYLMNSVDNTLRTEVLKKVIVHAKGPYVLIPIIESVGTYTYEAMELIKNKLEDQSLKSYLGENIAKLNVELQILCEQLYAAGYWRNDFLMTLIKKFKESTCEEFRQWLYPTIIQPTCAYLHLCCDVKEEDINANEVVTFYQILDEMTMKYEELMGSND